MITLTARCHPALEPILPKPVLAADALPDWLRTMPSEVYSDTLGGAPIRTLKHCPPLIDALGLGLLMPLATELTVRAGEVSWHWDPPPLPADLLTRAPIALHVPEQAAGTPLPVAGFIIKFTNFWTLEAPEGWSILFTHPLNREDLPFRTLAGVVECDRFSDGLVHFPAIWTDPDFEGTLPVGTPVAQAIPIPRQNTNLACTILDESGTARLRTMQQALQEKRGVYRRLLRGGA